MVKDYSFLSMQTAIKDPYKLKLGKDLQEKVDAALVQVCNETTMACEYRDSELRKYRYQLEGYSQPNTNQPWPGACQIEATISRELHTTLNAAVFSGARQSPYVCIESVEAEGIDQASLVETYLNIKADQFQYENALSKVIYLALEGRFGVMYHYTDQKIQRYFDKETVEVPGPDGQLVPAGEQINLVEEPKDFCVKFRTPDPWDFYVYPPTASGPQFEEGCDITIERMYLRRDDLVIGVLEQGFIKEKVDEMIQKGPSQTASTAVQERTDEFRTDGVDPAMISDRESGTWECFQLIGRMPWCPDEDNEPSIPEPLRYTDCLWMVCPSAGIVFKQAYSPAPEDIRPYSVYKIIDKPNRLEGEGICSIIAPIHEEMTAIERFGINNMNLEASPAMVVDERWLLRYNKWTVAPGRFMPRMSGDPIGPKALQWDVQSQQLIMPWLQTLDAQANRLAASQGANSAAAGKVYKSAQIHFAEGMQQIKFDLYLSNIQRGVVQSFEIMRKFLVQHMKDSGKEQDTAASMGRTADIELEMLDGEYRFFAQATSDSLTPAARLSRMQAVAEIVTAYWTQVPIWAQTGCLPYMWEVTHRLLILAGERNPERFIGTAQESQERQAQIQQQMAMQAAMQAGMAGMAQAGGGPTADASGNGGGGRSSALVPGNGSMSGMVPQLGADEMEGGGMMQAAGMNGAY